MNFIIAYGKYIVIAMTRMYSRILDYKGRTGRQEFWWGFAYYLGIVISGEVYTVGADVAPLWLGLDFIYELFIYLTIGALMMSIIRRLHDADRSGWAVLVILVPFIGFFMLLFLLVLNSADGPNKFGPKPHHWKYYT